MSLWKRPSEGSANSAKKPSGAALSRVPAPRESRDMGEKAGMANIGKSISIKGDVVGDEDTIIEGRVEGKITLKQHSVIIEESGRIDADITANSICVAGELHGNLHGTEQVVLLKTGRVERDIRAKSVTLETGTQFKGSIDMRTMETASRAKPSLKAAPGSSDSPTKTNGSTHRIAAS